MGTLSGDAVAHAALVAVTVVVYWTVTLTVFDAKLGIVKTAAVPKGAHCVVADDRGQAWVCDPDHGSLVVFSENP